MIHKEDTNNLLDMHRWLWSAKRRNAEAPLYHGLCTEVNVIFTNLGFLMTEWPESTGDRCYPVPAPLSWAGPMYGRRANESIHDAAYWSLPRWVGEYGSSRIRLMNYMIRRVERELDKRGVQYA